jgi:hypothetical protein
MPFNGNTYNPKRDWELDAISGVPFDPVKWNEQDRDFAAAISTMKQGVATLLQDSTLDFDTFAEVASKVANIDQNIAALQATDAAQALDISGRVPISQKGANNGVATLDGTGKIPAAQLPTSSSSIDWTGVTNKPTTITDIDSLLLSKISTTALAAATGSALVGHTAGGTGATTMSLDQYVKRAFDTIPYAYGVVADGVTDDTAALIAAVNYAATLGVAPNKGGVVKLPVGICKITGTIPLPGNAWVSIVGSGKASMLSWFGANNQAVLSMDAGSDESKISFAKFGIALANSATGVIGIQFGKTPGQAYCNITVAQMYFTGLHTCVETNTETDEFVFSDNYCLGYTAYGLRSKGGVCSNYQVLYNHFRGGAANSWAVEHNGGWGVYIEKNTVQSGTLAARAFRLVGVERFSIKQNYYEIAGVATTPGLAGNEGKLLYATNCFSGSFGENYSCNGAGLYSLIDFDGVCTDIQLGPHSHLSGGSYGNAINYFATASATCKNIYETGEKIYQTGGSILGATVSAWAVSTYQGPILVPARQLLGATNPQTNPADYGNVNFPVGTEVHNTAAATGGDVLSWRKTGAGQPGTWLAQYLDPGWTAYTPTVTSQGGAFSSISSTGRYRRVGKTLHLHARAVVGASGVGTATGFMRISFPSGNAPAVPGITPCGADPSAQSLVLFGSYPASDPNIYVTKIDYTTPCLNSQTIVVSLTCEVA